MKKKELDNYPDFSVLMSVYEKENYHFLDQALDSIENQTVVPTEIVLVEDGPISNELEKVVDNHRTNFANTFKVVKSIRNQGLGASLRLGTEFVSTNWIARMDSDDISVSNRFELQLKEIIKNPGLAVIGGQIQEFSRDPSIIVGYRKVPTSEPSLRRFIKWRSPFNHPSVMLNKAILNRVGGYIPYGNLEDYYLWARIIVKNYPVKNIDKILLKMRVDEGMYQRRGKNSNIRYFYALRKFLFNNGIINLRERIIGDWIMAVNILMPGWLRKNIYQHILHKGK
ncbi:glycosyltransferase [Limosilactobacillus secaliphilus]|uniref:Glycosyltransferase n=1 Tax=Limosilactobacillus secaliphilus TaxID=396268 RepID=A0A0R2IA94_9LACO|nr:glycosyltransferase [Limosilactobacillus secaliphilus]KRN58365.1 glycosyltransferase [Limosilactobacillus secaliphilus]